MPTYQYLCRNCGHQLEEFQSMSEDPLTTCPECRTENLTRIMGAGSGLIFKGTGFHLTDYRKASKPAPDGQAPKSPTGGTPPPAGDTPAGKD
jgi:putative FmdB family regulatory protein